VTRNGTTRSTSLDIENVTHLFLTGTDSNQNLGISGPRHIGNGTTERSLFELQLVDNTLNDFSVPDAHCTSVISRSDIFAVGAVSGDSGGTSMLGVDFSEQGVVQVSEDDVITQAVQNLIDTSRRTANKSRLTTGDSGKRSVEVLSQFNVVCEFYGLLTAILSRNFGHGSSHSFGLLC